MDREWDDATAATLLLHGDLRARTRGLPVLYVHTPAARTATLMNTAVADLLHPRASDVAE